jgi:hypothetical protein
MSNNTTIVTAALILAWTGSAVAEDEAQDSLNIYPVETWRCDYNDGKGPDDLDCAVSRIYDAAFRRKMTWGDE